MTFIIAAVITIRSYSRVVAGPSKCISQGSACCHRNGQLQATMAAAIACYCNFMAKFSSPAAAGAPHLAHSLTGLPKLVERKRAIGRRKGEGWSQSRCTAIIIGSLRPLSQAHVGIAQIIPCTRVERCYLNKAGVLNTMVLGFVSTSS